MVQVGVPVIELPRVTEASTSFFMASGSTVLAMAPPPMAAGTSVAPPMGTPRSWTGGCVTTLPPVRSPDEPPPPPPPQQTSRTAREIREKRAALNMMHPWIRYRAQERPLLVGQ